VPFTIERNDLSAVEADAIVVAANERLQITGGVGLTVALKAGLDELQAACNEIGFCPCGSAVATPAFNLQAKTIVHAVGPVWQGGDLGEADFLRSAYDAALECAAAEGARSVALPLISAGTYGFPADVSLAVARESIRTFLNRHDEIEVRLVLFSRESVTAGMSAYLDIAEYVDDHYVDEHPAWGTMVLGAPDQLENRFASVDSAAFAPQELQQPTRRSQGPLERLGSALEERRERRRRREGGRLSHREQAAQPETAAPPDEAPAATYAPFPGAAPEEAAAPATRPDTPDAPFASAAAPAPAAPSVAGTSAMGSTRDTAKLTELMNALDKPFSVTLLALIDERGMTDAQVYKRANMSRQLFSKIRSNAAYRPTKKTALALAVALGLNRDETSDLLARAGFTLSPSSKADVIVEYFITQGNHDIFEINEALYAFDQPLL